MPKPKDYDTDMKPFYDFQRAKEYHKKFIWKLIPAKYWAMREKLYELIIDTMLKDYQVPDDFHCGDEIPDYQPLQTKWAWNCLNYRVSSVDRPFIFMRKKDNALLN